MRGANAEMAAFLPGRKTEESHIACAGRGLWGIVVALEGGGTASSAAATAAGRDASSTRYRVDGDQTGRGQVQKELPTDVNPATARAFVDFQNGVTAMDIRLVVREGMRSTEHVKRYTTNGMATDQGKLSNISGPMVAADELGRDAPSVGLTTLRPPFTPTTFGRSLAITTLAIST